MVRAWKGTFIPLDSFHRVDRVGLPSPRSTWATMLRLTPLSLASSSMVSPRSSRSRRMFPATISFMRSKTFPSCLTLYWIYYIIILYTSQFRFLPSFIFQFAFVSLSKFFLGIPALCGGGKAQRIGTLLLYNTGRQKGRETSPAQRKEQAQYAV